MKVMDDGKILTIRFSPLSALEINREERKIRYNKREIDWEEIRGFWKNFVVKKKKKYFYVVMLTNKVMDRITPEMDEYDVDEVLHYLIEILGEDKYAR